VKSANRTSARVVALEPSPRVSVASHNDNLEIVMLRGGLLWLIGIPLPIIIILWLLGYLH
jgi:hypothetical protein